MTAQTGRILVVDDVEANRDLLARLLLRDGYAVDTVANGHAAMEVIRRSPPDLVLADVLMPHVDGFELCRRLKADRETQFLPVVLVTQLTDQADRIRGIKAGADDFLSKPVDASELQARVRSLIRLKHSTDELDSAAAVILTLARTVEARDAHMCGHGDRVAGHAIVLGAHLGLTQDEIAVLHRGGYLHDIGTIAVPEALLLNPGPLTRHEVETIKRHTLVGDELCGELKLLRPVRPIVRHHHERYDGSGYPDGLAGDDIPLLAQVVAIIDIYDALTHARVQRAALSPMAAITELRREADRGWHQRGLVESFIAACIAPSYA